MINERINQMEKSNKFLKVTGILMIIGGSFGLIASIFLLLFGVILAMGALLNPVPGVTLLVTMVTISILIAVAGAIVQFVAGVSGVKNAKNPEKANQLIFLGALTAFFYIVSQIMSFIGGAPRTFLDYIVVVFGLVVPALYLVGAYQLKSKED